MVAPSASSGRLGAKVLNGVFWALFVAVGAAAFVMAPQLGYSYSPDVSLATFTTAVQGVGLLLALAGAGLLFLKVKLDGTIASLEDRTLGVLNNRLGWSVIKWSDDLELRLEDEFAGGTYTAAAYEEEPPAEDYLEKELDDLLDAILVEEESGGGGRQVQQEVGYQETRSALSTDVREVIGAVRERRALLARRSSLLRTMAGPLGMLAVLLATAAWAIPAAPVFLASQPALNTALVFLSTYGGVVALVFAAVAGLKAATA